MTEYSQIESVSPETISLMKIIVTNSHKGKQTPAGGYAPEKRTCLRCLEKAEEEGHNSDRRQDMHLKTWAPASSFLETIEGFFFKRLVESILVPAKNE